MTRRLGSLRLRIVVVATVVTAICLAIGDVATLHVMRSSLTDRLDEQVVATASGPARRALRTAASEASGDDATAARRALRAGTQSLTNAQRRAIPEGSWAALVRRSDGEILVTTRFGDENSTSTPTLAASTLARAGDDPVQVRGSDGDGHYRVAVRRVGARYVLVVAASTDSITSSTSRLQRTEWYVGSAVLAAVALLGLIGIGRVLRPLTQLRAATNDIVDGGDLHRRTGVVAGDEVGELAGSIDQMLDRLEAAFAARDASEAELRRFVADASHELRTPVTAVRGYAELLRLRETEMTADERRDATSRIEREAARLGRLVEDLVQLTRMDDGIELRSEPIDLVELCDDAIHAARIVDDRWPVQLEAAAAQPVVVRGDHERLRQVLDNLLANVRVHTPAGTRVRVSVGADHSIDVIDAGGGLSAEERAHALARFWRADAARTAGAGSGLGLAIVDAVVSAHGGSVRLADGDANDHGGHGLDVHLQFPADGAASPKTLS